MSETLEEPQPDQQLQPAAEEASPEPERDPARAELEREGEIAADYLETLLDIADLDGDLEVDVEGDRAAVAIVDSEEGTVPRNLVGPSAQVLESLQELARLAVQAETGQRSRLMLDVGGYRAERRASLVSLARRIAEEVKEAGERRELEPMSAFERKVVHDEVLAAGLTSESEGEEPYRHVVVLPAS
ncbi:Jag family protein [Ornithinicoccus halotolerans]|uniref:Jag family protein n=1 Tax=Ornithinicoccus halotolerans TaxID=1748220 RepID=UPI001297A96A|nr:R3H domain-containing nucleic acid-binding protein [Ornithinicoccus halotolerans]